MAAPRPPDTLTGIDYAHQTRNWPAGPYEEALAEALEELFTAGVAELADIVAGLNRSTVRPPGKGAWTEDNFRSEMARLAA
jgi:hypothetical protein